jgi:uncharacterized protein
MNTPLTVKPMVAQIGKALALAPVMVFRIGFSAWMPPSCRFLPSCSDYAIQAINGHGALKGSWLAGKRLMRCHPWCKGGLDEVPTPNGALTKTMY